MAGTTCYCKKCGRTKASKEFYQSHNAEKYPSGYLDLCKDCFTMHVDNYNPETYLPLLQELDIPYIKEEWDKILVKYGQDITTMTGTTILGRYISKMKLVQWKEYRWCDTERLATAAAEKRAKAMREAGLSEDEIEVELAIDRGPQRPPEPIAENNADTLTFVEEPDPIEDSLTEEDKLYLRLKWGSDYRASEWVKMEQLYEDMMASYDIQSAGHKDTLIMICKASLKANQLIDANDIEGFQKMSKVYDTLMKSGRFTAAQTKAEEGEYVNCVGELVEVCEREGFIPRYYIDEPQDKVDRVLEDYQNYVRQLVTEEMGLGDMIENALREIERDKEKEAIINTDDEEERTAAIEASLYAPEPELTEEDYIAFNALRADFGEDDE